LNKGGLVMQHHQNGDAASPRGRCYITKVVMQHHQGGDAASPMW